MKKYVVLTKQFLMQVRKDTMLFIACFAPFLAGFAIHFGIPFLETLLTKYLNVSSILRPYFFLFDIMLAMMTPVLFSFVGAMVVLTEYDDNIVSYMAVTPVQSRGYIISRIVFPSGVSLIFSIIILKFLAITNISPKDIFIYSFFCMLLGLMASMLMVTISTNKVEGMAIGKLCSIILLGAFVPTFITTKLQYLTSFLPSFWLGKYIVTQQFIYIIVGFIVSIVWFYILGNKYVEKLK